MKTVHATVLTLGLVALLSAPAAAQGPRGFGARMGSYSGLLGNESVQKELKLDDKQVEKAKALEEKINGEMQEKFQGLQDLEPQERRAKMQEINREISASTLKAAGEFIKPEQIARLKQIAYQVRGAQAFGDPEVAKKLNLTDAQKTDIQTINMEAGQERRAIFQESQDDREGAMKKMAELNKKTLAKIEAKLNDEQQKTWKELLGSSFEIKYEQN
jgi:hypothetical protein